MIEFTSANCNKKNVNYQIRRLSLKDFPQFLALYDKALKEDFPEYQPKVAEIYRKHVFNKKYFKKVIRDKENPFFGAFAKDRLVGFLNVISEFGGAVRFQWLIINKDYRGKGAGMTLLKRAEDWALKHKSHYAYLYTAKETISYYEKRGYRYVGVMRKTWFGVDEYIMEKLLRDRPFVEMFNKYLKKEKGKKGLSLPRL